MSNFVISLLPYSTVLYQHSERTALQLDPEYQRESDIWTLEKRQLLIDSIINGYDIPKIYFHKFTAPKTVDGKKYTRAIIDGKQRLTSIWKYIDGEFPLSDNIEFIADKKIDLRGLTYAELGEQYPKLKMRFDSYPLSIVAVETDDLDMIEDMFSRLNEAVPLSAAEKRNAFGGPIPIIIRKVAKTDFCTKNLPFGNKRYRHYDLIAKFLIIENRNKVTDTKKVYLDDFVKKWDRKDKVDVKDLGNATSDVLAVMAKIFTASDPLLRSIGMVVLYYHVYRLAHDNNWVAEITRSKFAKFEKTRAENRTLAERDISAAQYDLLEFDRYVQTPNDAYAVSVRLKILLLHVFNREMPAGYES